MVQLIDEAMITFKGRSSMKQYMPMKPTKHGFSVWVRVTVRVDMCASWSVSQESREVQSNLN